MYCFFYKTIKYTIFGFLPLLLISSSAKNLDLELGNVLVNNVYLIPGKVDFKLGIELGENGDKFKRLNLVFTNTDTERKNSLELVLRSKYKIQGDEEEIYKINHIDGFLDGFEGVFGVYTHDDFGEMPFFANKGFVRIESLNENNVQGYLDLTLKNNNGRTIRISDSFRNF